MREIEYKGFLVCEDGRVFNKNGKQIQPSNGLIYVSFEGKSRSVYISRFLYEAYHNVQLKKNEIIVFIDGNKKNLSCENLKMVTRKEYFKGHDWSNMSKLTKEQKLEIARAYNRQSRRENHVLNKHVSPTYEELCEQYGISRSLVYKILNEYDESRGTGGEKE